MVIVMKPLPPKSDIFTRHQVSDICSLRRTKTLFMALISNYTKVAHEDIELAREVINFAGRWKDGDMVSFEETAKNCNAVIELSARYKNLLA